MTEAFPRLLEALWVHGADPQLSADGTAGNARCPCPGHGKGRGDRSPSLSIAKSPDGAALIRCFAGCSVDDIMAALGLTLRDLFPGAGDQPYRWRPTAVVARPRRAAPPDSASLGALAAQFRDGVRPETLADQADRLGLTVGSLQALDIGWSARHRAWTFPMKDGDGGLTGFRLRHANGSKTTIRGTHAGLFLPTSLCPQKRHFIAEGPTDTAALLDLGFNAIGRPSCSGGVDHLIRLIRRTRPSDIVIVADGDGPGQRGASRLLDALVSFAPVRLVTPPAKDVREWMVKGGCTPTDLLGLIDRSPEHRLRVSVGRRPSGTRT